MEKWLNSAWNPVAILIALPVQLFYILTGRYAKASAIKTAARTKAS